LADARKLYHDIRTFAGTEQFGDAIAVGKRLAGLPRNLDQLEARGFGKPSLAQLNQLQNFVLRWVERTQLVGVRERHRCGIDGRWFGGLGAFAAGERYGGGERKSKDCGAEPGAKRRP
jgi:hypothetical protein